MSNVINKKSNSYKRYFILIILLYIFFLIPFIIHSSIDNIVIIKAIKNIDAKDIPSDIKDIIKDTKSNYDILLVQDVLSKRLSAVIPDLGNYEEGSVVYLSSIRLELFVDWHSINLIKSPYKKLIIADIQRISPVEEFIERLLSTYFGKFIFMFSKVMFYIGPMLLIFQISHMLNQKLSIWMLIGALSCYSFEFFISNMIADLHGIEVSDMWHYFGYSFIIALPLTIKMFYFESNPEGQEKIENFAKNILGIKYKSVYYRKIL